MKMPTRATQIAIGGAFATVGLLAFLWVMSAPPPSANNLNTGPVNTPADIKNMWELPPEKPPEPPEKDRSKYVTADEIFDDAPSPPPPPGDPYYKERLERKRINDLRRKANEAKGFQAAREAMPDYGQRGWWSENDAKLIAGSYRKKPQWGMIDKDFDGEGKDVASFPVDLSRTITVDQMFSALLINDLRSDLGGQVVAQVSNPVYAAHGGLILIPAGSKAIAIYEPLDEAGQERLRLVWNRIITPAGISIKISAGETTDVMGRVGLTGTVDNRKTDKYRDALLVSLIPFSKATQAISTGMMEEAGGIPPRITIKGGTRITINPTTDIWFKKPVRLGGTLVASRAGDRKKGKVKRK